MKCAVYYVKLPDRIIHPDIGGSGDLALDWNEAMSLQPHLLIMLLDIRWGHLPLISYGVIHPQPGVVTHTQPACKQHIHVEACNRRSHLQATGEVNYRLLVYAAAHYAALYCGPESAPMVTVNSRALGSSTGPSLGPQLVQSMLILQSVLQ